MLTASENRAFDAWLCRVSARCERIGGSDLNDCQSLIESAGVLPEPGLRHLLCRRWRRGAAVGPTAGWVLEVVRRQCEAVANDQAGPLEAAADVYLSAGGFHPDAQPVQFGGRRNAGNARQCEERAGLAGHWQSYALTKAADDWEHFLSAIDSGFRAAADVVLLEREQLARAFVSGMSAA